VAKHFSWTGNDSGVQLGRYQLNYLGAMGATQDGKVYKYQLVTQADRQ